MLDDAGKQWVRWGEHDPWYGVLSAAQFRNGRNREAFFRSGEDLVAHILKRCGQLGRPLDSPSRVLEFGCGVGRILVPLAERFPRPVGIDISPGMLAEAEKLLPDGRAELLLATADKPLPVPENAEFDFIYSGLVFQHIPVRRGTQLLDMLLSHLAPGGVAVIQIPFRTAHKLRYFLNQVRASHQLLFDASRLLQGRFREVGKPIMQMNIYAPWVVASAARSRGCSVQWVEMDVDDFDYLELATWYLTRT